MSIIKGADIDEFYQPGDKGQIFFSCTIWPPVLSCSSLSHLWQLRFNPFIYLSLLSCEVTFILRWKTNNLKYQYFFYLAALRKWIKSIFRVTFEHLLTTKISISNSFSPCGRINSDNCVVSISTDFELLFFLFHRARYEEEISLSTVLIAVVDYTNLTRYTLST